VNPVINKYYVNGFTHHDTEQEICRYSVQAELAQ
jgi:hypothetical protein